MASNEVSVSLDFSAPIAQLEEVQQIIAQRDTLLAALRRTNTLLAELNFSEWIPRTDPASIDIRQRIEAAHEIAYAALAKVNPAPSPCLAHSGQSSNG